MTKIFKVSFVILVITTSYLLVPAIDNSNLIAKINHTLGDLRVFIFDPIICFYLIITLLKLQKSILKYWLTGLILVCLIPILYSLFGLFGSNFSSIEGSIVYQFVMFKSAISLQNISLLVLFPIAGIFSITPYNIIVLTILIFLVWSKSESSKKLLNAINTSNFIFWVAALNIIILNKIYFDYWQAVIFAVVFATSHLSIFAFANKYN